MPADTADFTSLTNFKKSIMRVDITAHLKCFSLCILSICLFDIIMCNSLNVLFLYSKIISS